MHGLTEVVTGDSLSLRKLQERLAAVRHAVGSGLVGATNFTGAGGGLSPLPYQLLQHAKKYEEKEG